MRRCIDWLWQGVGWRRAMLIALGATAACLAYVPVWTCAVRAMGGSPPTIEPAQIPFNRLLVIFYFYKALEEEAFFRFFPIAVGIERWGRHPFTFILLAASSAYFGWGHGGLLFVTLQGVHGFVWALVFLKCGGAERRYGKAIVASTLSHALYNSMLHLAFVYGVG